MGEKNPRKNENPKVGIDLPSFLAPLFRDGEYTCAIRIRDVIIVLLIIAVLSAFYLLRPK